jgi:superfamily I DNA/RNA helicase
VGSEPVPTTSPASLVPLFAEVAEQDSRPLSPRALSPRALPLSPGQRSIVERSYDGPAIACGGPGTGKTTVALHRVVHLLLPAEAGQFPLAAGTSRDVLLVTHRKYLAAGLRERLAQLGPQVAQRVDVINIDALAARVVAEEEPGRPRHWMDDSQVLELWELVLEEAGLGGDADWTPEFLHEEWTGVVLGHAINSRFDYFRVRRGGRGRHLNRAQRSVVWQLAERYGKRLSEANLWTFRQLIAYAVGLETARAADRGPRYRHVVADEAQDLSPAQLKLLRAMVAPGRNDLFLVGDPHQRVFNTGSLSSAGIDVRGRSAELTHRWRPVLVPELRGHDSPADELAGIAAQVAQWLESGDRPGSIGVAVRDSSMAAEVERCLNDKGVIAATIGADGPRVADAVHVGPLHRFKGLEYRRMILAGLGEGTQLTRPLLDMATSRARESLVISWHGAPSPLLEAWVKWQVPGPQ